MGVRLSKLSYPKKSSRLWFQEAANRSTMAGVQLVLVVLVCAVLPSALGIWYDPHPCFDARANAAGGIGGYVPQCDSTGAFKRKQIHASTGYSWCATYDGQKIVNTERGPAEGEPNCGEDSKKKLASCTLAVLNSKKIPGAYVPQCAEWGYFERKQCHSTGFCWCVHQDSGIQMEGTTKFPAGSNYFCPIILH